MAPITTENPTGIETFDHSRISGLPEYAVVSRALDQLVKAIERAEVEIDQAEWLRIVQQMASALPYTDTCENCVRIAVNHHRPTTELDPYPGAAPDGADVEDGWGPGPLPVSRVRHPLDLWVLGRRSAILTRRARGYGRQQARPPCTPP